MSQTTIPPGSASIVQQRFIEKAFKVSPANRSFHLTAIPLRSIAAGGLGRYAASSASERDLPASWFSNSGVKQNRALE